MSVHQKKGTEEPTATLQYCEKLLRTTEDIFLITGGDIHATVFRTNSVAW